MPIFAQVQTYILECGRKRLRVNGVRVMDIELSIRSFVDLAKQTSNVLARIQTVRTAEIIKENVPDWYDRDKVNEYIEFV